ncbi:putative membrane protein, YdjX family (SNARE domain) [Campylobacter iguaniorum]|uniref:TVP38/TMEM64 family protein n=1 Tax=Campylobacter iguaniorum TaxID=1244531 RepID=UPI0007C9BAD7|nr:VTT domain-containing protein [Campylobacter iguaniorum]ANE35323.1 putative membrane protein, YdjX family (SNARE domain) [Campylobacter iguaniorum]
MKTVFKFMFIVILACIGRILFEYIDIEVLKNFILKYENFAYLIYILLWSILPIFFFPVLVLSVVCGMVFGLEIGVILTSIGVGINASLMYFLSKFIGYEFIQNHLSKKHLKMLETNNEFFTILFLRLIPVIPYNLINLAAGFLGYKFSSFLAGTLLGKLPGIIIFLNLGVGVTKAGSSEFYVALACLVCLMIFALALKYFYEKFWLKFK